MSKDSPDIDSIHATSNSNDTSDSRIWKVRGVCVFLILIIFLVFGQTARQGFFSVDDSDYVFNNPEVYDGLTLQGAVWAFTHTHAANWHPLTWISHMLDYQLNGIHIGQYHLTNVKLHAASALLLFVALLEMTNALWRSAFVATVFAIHPLRVESVAWVAERKDVLSGVFFMLTLYAYVLYTRNPQSLRRYLTVILCLTLGLLSKPTIVTLPLLLLLLDYWPLQRFRINPMVKSQDAHLSIVRRLLLEKVPMFLLSAGTCIATVLAQKVAIVPVAAMPIPLRISNAMVSYVTYLGEMIFPAHLTIFYPYPSQGLPFWQISFSFLFLIFVSVGTFVWRRKHPYLLVGWLWYLGMLVPMIGLLQVGSQAHADRYTYLSQIGICILVTWLAADICGPFRHGRFALGAAASIIIAALAACAYIQTSYWLNDETFWTHALDVTPLSSEALCTYGQRLYTQGHYDEAIAAYEKVLLADPYNENANTLLAQSLSRAGRTDEFLFHYEMALTGNPESIGLRNAFAWILATSENSEVRDGKRAILLAQGTDELYQQQNGHEEDPSLLRTLAAAYAETENFSEAISTAQRALKICSFSKSPPFASFDYATMGRILQSDILQYKTGSPLRD
jgi:Tfp pilus assembly protein PilF